MILFRNIQFTQSLVIADRYRAMHNKIIWEEKKYIIIILYSVHYRFGFPSLLRQRIAWICGFHSLRAWTYKSYKLKCTRMVSRMRARLVVWRKTRFYFLSRRVKSLQHVLGDARQDEARKPSHALVVIAFRFRGGKLNSSAADAQCGTASLASTCNRLNYVIRFEWKV